MIAWRKRKETEYVNALIRRDSPVQLSTEYEPRNRRALTKCPMCGHIFKIAYEAYEGVQEFGRIPDFCEDCGQRLKRGGAE